MILAIDPGTRESGYIFLHHRPGGLVVGPPLDVGNSNHLIAGTCKVNAENGAFVVIEMVEHYGPDMRAGAETFETCVWIGRFMAAAGERARRMTRRTVKLHLCGSMRAKDADIRQAILDRFGGKEKAVGTKKAPGPLYGVKSHAWAALALALTYFDLGDAACYKPPGAP